MTYGMLREAVMPPLGRKGLDLLPGATIQTWRYLDMLQSSQASLL